MIKLFEVAGQYRLVGVNGHLSADGTLQQVGASFNSVCSPTQLGSRLADMLNYSAVSEKCGEALKSSINSVKNAVVHAAFEKKQAQNLGAGPDLS